MNATIIITGTTIYTAYNHKGFVLVNTFSSIEAAQAFCRFVVKAEPVIVEA